jgi:hypothetical protein
VCAGALFFGVAKRDEENNMLLENSGEVYETLSGWINEEAAAA